MSTSNTGIHRCYARIDLAALERNLGRIRAALPRHIRYIAVVKADAYGHGLRPMATRLMQTGADAFAVANANEGIELRELGEGWRILILGPALPEEYPFIIDYALTPTLSSIEEAEALNTLAVKKAKSLDVHLKIDTGMGRSGVWHEQAPKLLEYIRHASHLRLHGIFTHFSCADSDIEYTNFQRNCFLNTIQNLTIDELSPLWIHADNSAGLESFHRDSPFNAVRVGLLQFGIPPSADALLHALHTEPVLTFEARVCLVKTLPQGTHISYGRRYQLRRESRVAIVSAGYGDGIPRSMSGNGTVLIRDRHCPMLGTITMDQTIVDVSEVPEVSVGDCVTLLGSQGNSTISASDFAERAGTIPYEIFCSITKRVPRIYQTDRPAS